MWQQTKFAQRLGLDTPIVQGPFGSGLSAVDLVVAVSEAGGLGSFGVHHLPYDGIRDVAARIRARTTRAFALNLWIPFEDSEHPEVSDREFAHALDVLRPYFEELDVPLPKQPARFTPPYAEQVEAVLAARPRVFSFVFGIPTPDVLARCRELDIMTVGTVTTVDEAIALERAGVDAIVASGCEAGGHRISFLESAESSLIGTLALVPQVVDAVDVPVIAAGGIADGRGIAAALCLGAQAAQIGTAFLACDESAASSTHREQLHSPAARYTALTRAFTGRLARSIRNRLVDEMHGRDADLLPYPVHAWLIAHLKPAALARGRIDLISLWSGQSASLIRHRKARELMTDLVTQTEQVLRSH
jgi:nitronate monooxygenase